MATTRPPPNKPATKRPSAVPAAPKRASSAKVPAVAQKRTPSVKPPVRRETMEVDMRWLEPESTEPDAKKGPSRPPTSQGVLKRPPPVRRDTIDVRLEWLEEAEERVKDARRRSTKEMPSVRGTPPALPTQPEDPPKRRASSAGNAAARKGPPALPPEAAKKRALPPPLPREEPEEPKGRTTKRPPRG
ncbi:MAG: hypothetical protein IPM79_26640 [Polyangiaceae bacterium]|jgi:hypothetical protein|nr:hypothetical protein [Polyangiaceae bacterium]MBK8941094.1 hypothetical protein [Polyangiaceae bacterium]